MERSSQIGKQNDIMEIKLVILSFIFIYVFVDESQR